MKRSKSLFVVSRLLVFISQRLLDSVGPPPQVASLAGKKDGMKQGPLGGILKELGYTEDQVGSIFFPFVSHIL